MNTSVTWDALKKVAHAIPGVNEGSSYGTPALFVGKKLIARLREGASSVAVRTDPVSGDFLLRADPGMFFLTDHYREYPWILVRLAGARPEPLRELLEAAWRLVAGKRAIAGYDARSSQ